MKLTEGLRGYFMKAKDIKKDKITFQSSKLNQK